MSSSASTQLNSDYFTCSICLSPYTSAPYLLRDCSHQFCLPCIKECLNRKKNCPMCAVPIGSSNNGNSTINIDSLLIKNTPFWQLMQQLKETQKDDERRRMAKLIPMTAASSSSSHGINDDTPPHLLAAISRQNSSSSSSSHSSSSHSSSLSPIELLFRSYISSRTFTPAEKVWDEMKERKERMVKDVGFAASASAAVVAESATSNGDVEMKESHTTIVPGGVAPAVASSSSPSSLASITRSQSTITSLYESYLLSLPTPPFLEPIWVNCTLNLTPGASANIPAASSSSAAAASSSVALPASSSSSSPSLLKFRIATYSYEDLSTLYTHLVAESQKEEHSKEMKLKEVNWEEVIKDGGDVAAGVNAIEVCVTRISSSGGAASNLSSSASSSTSLPYRLTSSLSSAYQSFSSHGLCSSSPSQSLTLDLLFTGSYLSSHSILVHKKTPVCFINEWKEGEERRMDYFKCVQCAVNC